MSRRIRRLPLARLDLTEIFYHLASEASLETARQFLLRTRETFQQLANFPGLGTRYVPEDGRFSELRYLPVTRFRNYIVFYRSIEDGVEIFRVLHGARDLTAALAERNDRPDGPA